MDPARVEAYCQPVAWSETGPGLSGRGRCDPAFEQGSRQVEEVGSLKLQVSWSSKIHIIFVRICNNFIYFILYYDRKPCECPKNHATCAVMNTTQPIYLILSLCVSWSPNPSFQCGEVALRVLPLILTWHPGKKDTFFLFEKRPSRILGFFYRSRIVEPFHTSGPNKTLFNRLWPHFFLVEID